MLIGLELVADLLELLLADLDIAIELLKRERIRQHVGHRGIENIDAGGNVALDLVEHASPREHLVLLVFALEGTDELTVAEEQVVFYGTVVDLDEPCEALLLDVAVERVDIVVRQALVLEEHVPAGDLQETITSGGRLEALPKRSGEEERVAL